jgi:hypothetical protein
MMSEFETLWAERPWYVKENSDKEIAESWFNLGRNTRPADGELVNNLRFVLAMVEEDAALPEGNDEAFARNTINAAISALQGVRVSRECAEKFVRDFENTPQKKLVKIDQKHGCGISEMYLHVKQALGHAQDKEG